MAFDAMAAAIDWLDAYRAQNLNAILAMYAPDATIECGCDGLTMIAGEAGLRSYWQQRFAQYPATELEGISGAGNQLDILYRTGRHIVAAAIEFDDAGQITSLRCAPMKDNTMSASNGTSS